MRVTSEQMAELGWDPSTCRIDELNDCINRFGINNIESLRHFLSQCSQETTCGKYRLELASGQQYENDIPGYGNTERGDGPKYKGAGYIQLTGRRNYQLFANRIGDPQIMEQGARYVADNYPWKAAGFYWEITGLNGICARGTTCEEVTRIVNGPSMNQLEGRRRYYGLARQIFK